MRRPFGKWFGHTAEESLAGNVQAVFEAGRLRTVEGMRMVLRRCGETVTGRFILRHAFLMNLVAYRVNSTFLRTVYFASVAMRGTTGRSVLYFFSAWSALRTVHYDCFRSTKIQETYIQYRKKDRRRKMTVTSRKNFLRKKFTRQSFRQSKFTRFYIPFDEFSVSLESGWT